MSNLENENSKFSALHLTKQPEVNVIGKNELDARVVQVFNTLYEKLSMSFGPFGAATFVSNFPHMHTTKDGFTIMKNIYFAEKLDQIIADLAASICGRLNYSVGDGTTTAIISTKTIYDGYSANADYFKEANILPREIMAKFENIKKKLIQMVEKEASPIRSEDPEVLRQRIYDIVHISSNANDEISTMISDLYAELMYPAINCIDAVDGITKATILNGYGADVALADKLYINSDDNTMKIGASDVIMFDHKVTEAAYTAIIRPLSNACKDRGRHLIVIAPYYDEVALSGVIRNDLMADFKSRHEINTVITTVRAHSDISRTKMHDLAMLLNTPILTKGDVHDYIEYLDKAGSGIYNIFDLDNRNITGASVAVYADDNSGSLNLDIYDETLDQKIFNVLDNNIKVHRVGYIDSCSLGLAESIFTGFHYDEREYSIYLNDAKVDLEQTERKYQSLGTFNVEVSQKQKRLYALTLKMGTIEVGGTSDITQGYLKDAVIDAIHAASSAFNNGVVLGCNVTLLRCIEDLIISEWDDKDDTDVILLNILKSGFESVYKKVMENGYGPNPNFTIQCVGDTDSELAVTDYDTIVKYSVKEGVVFDLGNKAFTNTAVKNSAETDIEILKATIDLISLLITGNQMVVC